MPSLTAPTALLLSLVLWIAPSRAVLVNRSIDDEFGDAFTGLLPLYQGCCWEQGSTCTGCHVRPPNVSVDRALYGTWHDATYHPNGNDTNITVTFIGSAVYVFHLLSPPIQFTTTNTHLDFILDGVSGTPYDYTSAGSDFSYNVNVFSQESLPHANHTLTISGSGSGDSLILFDYVLYTTESDLPDMANLPNSTNSPGVAQPDPTGPSTPDSDTGTADTGSNLLAGPVIGGIIGGLAAATIIILGGVYLLRKRIWAAGARAGHDPELDKTQPPGNHAFILLDPEAESQTTAADPGHHLRQAVVSEKAPSLPTVPLDISERLQILEAEVEERLRAQFERGGYTDSEAGSSSHPLVTRAQTADEAELLAKISAFTNEISDLRTHNSRSRSANEKRQKLPSDA